MDPVLQDLLNEYISTGPAEYDWLGDLNYKDLDPATLARMQDSELANIATDPRYDQYMLSALQDLEDQAKSGFTVRDEADMARIEAQNRRALRGAEGAIKQNMAARGIQGSGLEFIGRQQAAQDAADRQALAGLEKMAQMNERKQSAAARLGSLGSQFQGQQFDQRARQASAQDAINRFNTGNTIAAQMQNNQGRNAANQFNQMGRQDVANRNVSGRQGYRDKALDYQYNTRVDDLNRRALEDAEKRRRKAGQMGAILGTAGAVAGGAYGGPAGAGAGYTVGSGLGSSFAAHGGEVTEDTGMDSYENDTKMIFVSPGEVVVPKSKADSPIEAAMFVESVKDNPEGAIEERNEPDNDDVVGALISVIDTLTARKRRPMS